MFIIHIHIYISQTLHIYLINKISTQIICENVYESILDPDLRVLTMLRFELLFCQRHSKENKKICLALFRNLLQIAIRQEKYRDWPKVDVSNADLVKYLGKYKAGSPSHWLQTFHVAGYIK